LRSAPSRSDGERQRAATHDVIGPFLTRPCTEPPAWRAESRPDHPGPGRSESVARLGLRPVPCGPHMASHRGAVLQCSKSIPSWAPHPEPQITGQTRTAAAEISAGPRHGRGRR
jgi:hypothetical protein